MDFSPDFVADQNSFFFFPLEGANPHPHFSGHQPGNHVSSGVTHNRYGLSQRRVINEYSSIA